MKKIFVHLGFPRTGTTALQYELKKFKKIKLFSRNSDEDIKEFYSFLYKMRWLFTRIYYGLINILTLNCVSINIIFISIYNAIKCLDPEKLLCVYS